MKKRLVSLGFATLAFLMVMSLLPTSVSAVDVNQGNDEVIIYSMPYDFNEYSVFQANSYATAQWAGAVYSGLVKRSSANNRGWVPDAAASMPTFSSDGLTFTFELRENLYFSNEEKLTVDDVEFSMKVSLAPAINIAGYSTFVGFIDNSSMTVHSSNSFSITLLQNFAFPYSVLSFPLVPQETYGEKYDNCLSGVVADCTWNAEDGSDAVGSGPFMVSDIDNTNEIVTLEANPFWWDADTVKTDKIIFQKITEKQAAISSLADGSIHILDSQYIAGLTELDSLGSRITQAFVGAPATQEISINHKHPYFGTGESIPNSVGETNASQVYENARLLRYAMSHVVDRDIYVSEIMEGLAEPAVGNMPSASLGWDPTITPPKYSVTDAKAIMEGLGFDYSVLGAPDVSTGAYSSFFFSIKVLSPNTNPARNLWSSDYVDQLKKIGIGVTDHISTGWAEIIPRTFGSNVDPGLYDDGGYDIFFVGYSWALDWNPAGLYDESGSCSTGSCGNYYNFDLDETKTAFAEVVNDYLTELDFDARLEKVGRVQELIAYWVPILGILFPQSHWGWSSDVNGIDSLLISVSSQEWDLVYRSGFELNIGRTPDGETNDGSVPFNTSVFITGILASFIAVFVIRKRNNLN